mgnify:CR=1 FL=1
MSPIMRTVRNKPKVNIAFFIILLLLVGCVHKPPTMDKVIVVPHLNTDKPGMVVK